MNDAISRSDLERRIRVYADQVHCRGEVELANGILKSLGIVRSAPALEKQTDVHGFWKDGRMGIVCSACGAEFDSEISYMQKYPWTDENPKYCPDCGARMDGDPHDSGQ